MKIWEKYRNLKIGKEFGNNLKFEQIFTIWEIGSLKEIWKKFWNLGSIWKFGKKFGNSGSIWKFGNKLKYWEILEI